MNFRYLAICADTQLFVELVIPIKSHLLRSRRRQTRDRSIWWVKTTRSLAFKIEAMKNWGNNWSIYIHTFEPVGKIEIVFFSRIISWPNQWRRWLQTRHKQNSKEAKTCAWLEGMYPALAWLFCIPGHACILLGNICKPFSGRPLHIIKYRCFLLQLLLLKFPRNYEYEWGYRMLLHWHQPHGLEQGKYKKPH